MIPITTIYEHLSLGDKLELIQLLKAEGLLLRTTSKNYSLPLMTHELTPTITPDWGIQYERPLISTALH